MPVFYHLSSFLSYLGAILFMGLRCTFAIPCCAILISIITVDVAYGQARDTAELPTAIKRRLYKTRNSLELITKFGMIVNHPYVQTLTPQASLTYFITPNFGLSLDGTYGMNSDRPNRKCIETFVNPYDNPNLPKCLSASSKTAQEIFTPFQGLPQAQQPNIGPAYVSILEPQLILTTSLILMPVYGKLLAFMNWVFHFNYYLLAGGGITINDFYGQKSKASTGHPLRGPLPIPGTLDPKPGVSYDQVNEYGTKGRPKPRKLNSPTGHLGLGFRVIFTQNLSLHLESRAIVIGGLPTIKKGVYSYKLYFNLLGGLGFRI
ncbi:MAG: outer membrane beta-barrel domain-containing protein [Proteobacteria bacterium]|nr:outer membrane beta-barrel domain-containing protein [Pseudomonadota bacterium]